MEACTSVTILVPVVWLSAFTVVAYFLTLTIAAIVYAPSQPDIWQTSVYAVPWFSSHEQGPLTHKSSSSTSSTSTTSSSKTLRSKGIWDEELKDDEECASPRRCCPSIPNAPWARSFQNRSRRGRDRPFATRSQVIAANPHLPMPPPKAHPVPFAARYLELTRPFSNEVYDVDKPLPIPETLSQWIRADLAEGKTVHTRPPITPR
jgi:hypothetical protein